MAKLNEVRRKVDLRPSLKKDNILKIEEITTILGIIIVFLFIILVIASHILYNLSLGIKLYILCLSLIGFFIYFFAGAVFIKYLIKWNFETMWDKKFYYERIRDRIRDIKNLKLVLKVLLFWIGLTLLARFFMVIIVMFLESIWKLKLSTSPLATLSIGGFINSGVLLGILFSLNKYSDWIKNLEK